MGVLIKIIITIFLLLVGLIVLGYPVDYFFGRILVRIALFGFVLSMIGAVWRGKNTNSKGN